jgi:hypothetical protein
LAPFLNFCMIVFFHFKKDYPWRAPSNQSFVVNQLDLPYVHISHSFILKITLIWRVNIDNLTLSVKHIDVIQVIIKKRFLRKVLLGAAHFHQNWRPFQLFCGIIVDEVVVHQSLIMKESHKYSWIIRAVHISTNDKRIWKSIYRHCEAIELQLPINVQLICINSL